MNKDVREAIRYLEHAIDHAQDQAEDTEEMNIYGALWTDMANATARCASDLEHKKIAPGVGSTESEKDNQSKSSVSEKYENVKARDGAYIIARHVGNDMGRLELSGSATELATCCAGVISGLAERLPKLFTVAAILTGCDHAGITVDELVSTYKEAHGHV